MLVFQKIGTSLQLLISTFFNVYSELGYPNFRCYYVVNYFKCYLLFFFKLGKAGKQGKIIAIKKQDKIS